MLRICSTLTLSMLILAGCADGNGTESTPAGTIDESSATTVETSTSTAKPATGAEPAWAIQGFDGTKTVIEVVSADGTGRVSVTKGIPGTDQTNPDWSPDGSMLTFGVTDGGGRDDLWTVNVDGFGARKVFDCEAECAYIDDAAWAPDGASIAVCEMDSSGADHLGSLVSIDVATGAKTTLAGLEPKDFCSGARWSPDGQRLVMEVVHRDGTRLESIVIGVTLSIVDVSVTPATFLPLTEPASFAATADWNDAGDLIVYSALATPDAAGPELFTIKPDGTGLNQLTSVVKDGGMAEEPSFNRDGTAVVFVDRTAPGLVSVDLATGTITPAFGENTAGQHPRVRPPT